MGAPPSIPRRIVKKTALDRFWAAVEKTDDCWVWTGSKSTISKRPNWQYPKFFDGTKTVRAHRFAYELLVGPIPDGMHLDHTCTNTMCVNPAHMEPATNKKNLERQGVRQNNRSGFRGVYFSKKDGKWVAAVTHNLKKHYGGFFNTPEEANEAVIALRRKLYGEDPEREGRLEKTHQDGCR